MVVDAGMEYNFVFQLPRRPTDTEDHFVVPGALQMGWKNSPAYFCTTTETTLTLVRRILALTARGGLATGHRHEAYDGAGENLSGPDSHRFWLATSLILLRVFVDDFLVGAVAMPPEARTVHEALCRWAPGEPCTPYMECFPRQM